MDGAQVRAIVAQIRETLTVHDVTSGSGQVALREAVDRVIRGGGLLAQIEAALDKLVQS
jgi:hypothetical protein